MMQNHAFPPDFSDEEVRWLCTDAIIDLQFRESNATGSFWKETEHHFVLWELESGRITIENLLIKDF